MEKIDPILFVNPFGLMIEENDTFIAKRKPDDLITEPLYSKATIDQLVRERDALVKIMAAGLDRLQSVR